MSPRLLQFSVSAAIVAAIGVSIALAEVPVPEFAEDDPARIWIEGDAIHYSGAISLASQDVFLDFVATEDTSAARRFVINSLGGDTHVGRVIGRWIYDQGLSVVVDAICFSSCANYVFPAGTSRSIRADSFVGWHGSETQYEVTALSIPGKSGEDLERESLRAALLPVLPEDASDADIEQAVDQQIELANASRQDEAEFFATLGIDAEFTVHGLRPGNIEAWRQSGRAGWTYTLEDMKRLGLGPIQYLGEGDYATSRQVIRNVFVAPLDPEEAPTQ